MIKTINQKSILRLVVLLFVFLSTFMLCCFSLKAETNTDEETSQALEQLQKALETDDSTNHEDRDSEVEKVLTTMFGKDVWNGANLAAGIQIASPFIRLILILSAGLVVFVCYAFFGTISFDMCYILVPFTRGLFYKGDSRGSSSGYMYGGGTSGQTGGNFTLISEAAIRAVNGDSRSGSMGSMNGDRATGVGSCFLRYAKEKGGELVAFFIFVFIVFTGLIGQVVIVIYKVFSSLLYGFLNIAG